jgi:hypothetical protein
MSMKTKERSCTIPHNEGRRLRPNDTDFAKTGSFLVLFERGWRRRAVFWHVCAMRHAGQTQGRIHPDKKRRDVCATREIGEARKRLCGLARRHENAAQRSLLDNCGKPPQPETPPHFFFRRRWAKIGHWR